MSVFFTADMSDLGAFTGKYPDGSDVMPVIVHLVPGIGCSGGTAFACHGNYVYETFAGGDIATMTVRTCAAFYSDGGGTIFPVCGVEAAANTIGVGAEDTFGVRDDGAVVVGLRYGFYTDISAAGLVPIDGLPHGLQFSEQILDTHHVTYQVGVDGSMVFSASRTFTAPTSHSAAFGRCYWWATRSPLCGAYNVPGTDYPVRNHGYVHGMSATYGVELDNAVSITGYSGCSGTTPLSFDTCWKPATVTAVIPDAGANNLTLLGTHFFGGPAPATSGEQFLIYGPGGGQLGYTAVSSADTQFVAHITGQYDELGVLQPFTVGTGRYCIYHHNRCA